MGVIAAEWKYTDRVPRSRQASLADSGSFDELLARVVVDATVTRAYSNPGSDRGLTDCLQPIFVIDLPNTGDALFNGPWGYRAQYWVHPSRGLAANRELISALTPKLLAAVDLAAASDLQKIDVCSALAASSAKIWVRESLAHLRDSPPDLAVERWLSQASKGIELAQFGLVAPEATKFEVKGALMDPYGNEAVPARKIRRHLDIHYYGYS